MEGKLTYCWNELIGEDSDACVSIDGDFARITVWIAGMVDESRLVSSRFCIHIQIALDREEVELFFFVINFGLHPPVELNCVDQVSNVLDHERVLWQIFDGDGSEASMVRLYDLQLRIFAVLKLLVLA